MYKTCEYWVHAMCLGITATSKAPLSRIGWKCLSTYPSIKKTSKKIIDILYYYVFFFKFIFTFSSFSMHRQTFSHFLLSGTPLWIHILVFLFLDFKMKSPPSPLDSLPETLKDSFSSRNIFIISEHWSLMNESRMYVSMYIGMFRPKKGRKLTFTCIYCAIINCFPEPSSEYMEGEAIGEYYLCQKLVVWVTYTQVPLVKAEYRGRRWFSGVPDVDQQKFRCHCLHEDG